MSDKNDFVTIKKWASELGVSEGVVRGWLQRGYVSSVVKVGKYLLIDRSKSPFEKVKDGKNV